MGTTKETPDDGDGGKSVYCIREERMSTTVAEMQEEKRGRIGQ